jgi:NAD(P)-dependent dehydrogenase (short-subunit alcohol dehydrogenase family)
LARLYRIPDKVVLVTGAASGIGRAAARELHARGARVVIADLDQNSVDQLAQELGDGRALSVAVDVTNRSALDAGIKMAAERFGGLDVVFANAGIAAERAATIATIDEASFERVVEVDLLGVWRTVRAALPQIVARQGHVLMNASVYAFVNGAANASYAIAKAGVEQFGRALRLELASQGATAGVLYPGWAETPIIHAPFGGDQIATQLVEAAFPAFLRRPIKAEVVAKAAVNGIERRSARVIVPRRWAPFSALRGLINPLTDRHLERDARIGRLLGELDRRDQASLRDAA